MGRTKNTKTIFKAASLSLMMGMGLSLSAIEAHAGVVNDVKTKADQKTQELSDQQMANIYLRKNPEASTYMRDSEAEFKERLKTASSRNEKKAMIKEFEAEQAAVLTMYANLERRDREIAAMKAGDLTKGLVNGEPKGHKEARRMAAQCGRGETVGYSNYFGDKTFYSMQYPLLGPEFADIEAIPLLREGVLPRLDSKIRKFFKDKQLTFTSMELNRKRSSTHSPYHETGGQKEYSDRILKESGEHHRNRSSNLSDELFRDVFTALKRFSHTFRDENAVSRYQRESSGTKRSGTEILAECRHYWSKGNTVKYYDPNDENNRFGFTQRRNESRRIGILPSFVVAEPVSPRGEPLAKQNLVANEYDKQINAGDISNRSSRYERQLSGEEKRESADDIVKRNFGDDFQDPAQFKKIEGGMDVQNGSRASYQRDRNKQAEKSLKGSIQDEFKSGKGTKSIMKLNFDDIYR